MQAEQKNKDRSGKEWTTLTPEEHKNVGVWEHTKRHFKRLHLKLKASVLYDIHQLPEIKTNESDKTTTDVTAILSSALEKLSLTRGLVEVVDQDTFEQARKYVVDLKLKTLVLSFASEKHGGGGVGNGRESQEEELFRRSNAHDTHPQEWYPLKENQVIYSPEVTVIKNAKNEMMDKPFTVGMISCAAIRHPQTKGLGASWSYKNEEDREMMRRKINAIFHVAALHEYEAVVLGSLGCGCFKNPPREVAQLFADALRQWKHSFVYNGFAVLVIKNDRTNLETFERTLSS